VQRHARAKSMPLVFSLQLAWESVTESADAIVGTLDAMVSEEVDLGAAIGNPECPRMQSNLNVNESAMQISACTWC